MNSLPWSSTGPRVLKMGDYFQDYKSSYNKPSLLNQSAIENALLASGPPVPISISEMDLPIGFN